MDREPMTDKERDDALIAEKKRLAYFLECKEGTLEAEAMFRRAAALLRGDEPAKPDRYVALWNEMKQIEQREGYAAAIGFFRKHFEPSAEVIEAAGMVKAHYNKHSFPHAHTLADHILKGDQ